MVLILLLTVSGSTVLAQDLPPDVEPEIVYITTEYPCGNSIIADTLEVWNVGAAGGPAYAAVIYPCHGCAGDREVIELTDQCTGTFTGGPNGTATISYCYEGSCVEGTFQFVNGEYVTMDGIQFPIQNPEAFAAWFTEPITAEYIYTTYGISVEDTSADDVYGQKSWSPQELILLNDVLKELPKGLLDQMAISRIVRSEHDIDTNGNPNNKVFGFYAPCGSPPEKDCSPQAATIRIFDFAQTPFDFSDDPGGYKQFKGTILHELTHSLQYKKDTYSVYRSPYNSPIMQNYMDATRQITNIDDPGFEGVNGWKFGHFPNSPPPKWTLFTDQTNGPPTKYGGTNPLEDMSESVMMYVYQPETLKNSSPARYNFIRDFVFEGVEYENGTQTKP